jgi:dTDP-4-dehydrorhamnose reductase
MIVVLGAAGQLGTAFMRRLPHATALTRSELDLAHATPEDVADVLAGARIVINCAAYTAVDRAESEEGIATAVNGTAVGRLAEVTATMGVPFVTFSTDYVFAGTGTRPYLESDPTDPVNAYGRSKLAGERAALAANPRCLVIRTSWVVSGTHPNFIATMLRLAGDGKALRVVDDQQGRPTMVDDLAPATLDALAEDVTGVLHLTNQGETTWYTFARAALAEAGLDVELISPCTTAEYPTAAVRPAYSVLGSEVVERVGLTPLPPWHESLPNVVEGLRTSGVVASPSR